MGEAAAPFAIISFCFAPLAFFILRYDRETAKMLDQLQSFRQYLKRFPQTFQKYGADWQRVDKLVVYAVALGLTSAQTKHLLETVERERGEGVFSWFIYANSNAPTGISAAMAAMVDAIGTTMSSASGAGGGASSGGGGGAGGSGGGAG